MYLQKSIDISKLKPKSEVHSDKLNDKSLDNQKVGLNT